MPAPAHHAKAQAKPVERIRAAVLVDRCLSRSSAGLVSTGNSGRACGRSGPPPCWQSSHHAPLRQHHRAAPATDLSRVVQNPSEVCQGFETARSPTLTTSRSGKTSDARRQGLLPAAWPALRQSVVKQAPSTTGNVRQCRPPGLPTQLGVRPQTPSHAASVSYLSHIW